MEDVLILGGARTPFGTFGGALRDISAVDLGVAAARAALERTGVPAAAVDEVVVGNVIHTGKDGPYLARHIALYAGVPVETPALTVNRLCGSGLQAAVSAAHTIRAGEASVALVGGAESMSQAPYHLRGRFGAGIGAPELGDALWETLTDSYCGCGMAITAENLAERYGISREEQDRFALLSQQRAAAARERLAEEIVPVELPPRRGAPSRLEQDEHPRPDTTYEALARLPARFKEGGTVTAGNASGINDGAAMLVLASERRAGAEGWRPLGRLVSWAVAGVDPRYMGMGPVPASRKALERAGLTLEEMDLVEVNEAFAAQYLAVEKELELDRERTNVNGGAIALGHPVGASGARLLLTLLLELRRRGGRYGLATLCIGGGQGIAAVVEAFPAS
ncbi:acetyl-CoA C-acetyltransferase [Symbiobacterium thermophilum]|uniref:acetyl-CoA C-acetyltransferase n=1 Tax=Symbiobacterium thermophilum TaxID=2734 RepID=UPI00235746E6|nr:acetyl-CoA C-acetyltransferase [Symbiobacterium thermophilum]